MKGKTLLFSYLALIGLFCISLETSAVLLSSKKPVSVSSPAQGAFVGSKLTDDSFLANDRWTANSPTYPQSAVVDLGANCSVDSTEIWPNGTTKDYKYTIEGSLDSLTFFPMLDSTDNVSMGARLGAKFPAQTARYVRLTITGAKTYAGNFSSLIEFRILGSTIIPPDVMPDQFTIVDQTNAAISSSVISDPFTVTGINSASPISLSNNTEIASYSINGGPFTSDAGTVVNNDVVRVQLTTGATNSFEYKVTVTIGGVNEDFSLTTIAPADLTPDQFTIADQVDVAISSSAISDPFTVTGIDAASPISLSNNTEAASYSINGGPFTSDAGTVVNNDVVRVQLATGAINSYMYKVTVTIGGVNEDFILTTVEPADLIPDQFTITDLVDVAISSSAISAPFTVTGINAASPISISNNSEIASYSINGGTFTSDAGTVVNNDVVRVQLATGSANSTKYSVTITIGGVSEDFTITTLAPADLTPDQFTITDKNGVAVSSSVISDAFTVTGINGDSPISLSNNTQAASYSINGGEFTSAVGTVVNNDQVRVKLSAGSENNVTYNVTVTIGGVSDDFNITTERATSLNQLENNSLSLFPNPTSNIINISGIQEDGSIEIYNLSGIMVKSVAISTSSKQIDLSVLDRGVYIVKIITGSTITKKQLILN